MKAVPRLKKLLYIIVTNDYLMPRLMNNQESNLITHVK
nr:MAG TPA: hypothetical protein [Bacteriophage sp.]